MEDSKPARHAANGSPHEAGVVHSHQSKRDFDILSIYGVLATAISSFLVAWALHWVRSSATRSARIFSTKIILVLFLGSALVSGFYGYMWRYRSQRLRRNVIDAVSSLIADSHALDRLTSTALTLIQEIEVVARGYEL